MTMKNFLYGWVMRMHICFDIGTVTYLPRPNRSGRPLAEYSRRACRVFLSAGCGFGCRFRPEWTAVLAWLIFRPPSWRSPRWSHWRAPMRRAEKTKDLTWKNKGIDLENKGFGLKWKGFDLKNKGFDLEKQRIWLEKNKGFETQDLIWLRFCGRDPSGLSTKKKRFWHWKSIWLWGIKVFAETTKFTVSTCGLLGALSYREVLAALLQKR